MAQSILSNTVVAAAGRAGGVLLGVAVTSALTRLLGVEVYGNYALLLSYGALLLVFADLGLYLTLTREIAHHPSRERDLVGQAVSLRLIAAGVVFVLGAGIALALPPLRPLLPAFGVVSLGFLFQSISQLFMGVFQNHAVVWRAALGDLAGRLLQLAGLLLIANLNLISAAVLFLISTASAHLIHRALLPGIRAFQLGISWSVARNLIKTSWPLAALLVINVIYFRIDMVILSLFRPPAEVGFYGLAYRVVESALFIPAMFGGLLLPKLTQGKSGPLLSAGAGVMAVAGLMAAAVLSVFSAPLITFLSGEDFAPAASLLAILSLALLAMFIGNVFGFALVAFDQQKKLMALYGLLAAANLIANILLIPRYGAPAAAWTTVVTEAIAMVTAGAILYRLKKFRFSEVINFKHYRLLAVK